MLGRTVGHYRIIEKIGAGGMGEVWLGEDTRLGRRVALKFLPEEAALDGVRRQRFEQEARAAAALSDPAIATVHELADTEGQPYIVFEYVPGSTLRNFVKPGGLPQDELLQIASDIAEALAAAHSAGVVHRDLKPENVMRTPAGRCKVLDFGLARLSAAKTPDAAGETRSALTSAGIVVGTAGYMAPEQLEGKEVDFRADIFAFGTLVYELATGLHPFQSSSAASTIAAIMASEPPPLTEQNPQQPPELERIVRKCLRKRREERYQSTLDLIVDLRNLRHDSGGRPSSLAAVVAPTSPVEQDSLLRAIFARIGVSPRRLWQMHSLIVVFVYVPLMTYILFHAGTVFHPRAPGPAELVAFISFIGCLIGTVGIRLCLVCLSVFLPGRLEPEVHKRQWTVRGLDLSLAVLLAIPTLVSLKSPAIWTHGALLAALAAASLVMAATGAWIGPALDRAAFPQAFAEADKDRTRTLRLGIAAAQIFYILPLWMPAISGKVSFDQTVRGISLHPSAAQVGNLAYGMVMLMGSIALLISAGRLLLQGPLAVRHFRRWFPAYLMVEMTGTGGFLWPLLEEATAVVVVSQTAILLALPFAQWRMAKQALRESGELNRK